MSSYIGSDTRSIQRSIVNHVEYTLGMTRFNFDDFGAYQAAALSVRDRLIESWNDTNEYYLVRYVNSYLIYRLMMLSVSATCLLSSY